MWYFEASGINNSLLSWWAKEKLNVFVNLQLYCSYNDIFMLEIYLKSKMEHNLLVIRVVPIGSDSSSSKLDKLFTIKRPALNSI